MRMLHEKWTPALRYKVSARPPVKKNYPPQEGGRSNRERNFSDAGRATDPVGIGSAWWPTLRNKPGGKYYQIYIHIYAQVVGLPRFCSIEVQPRLSAIQVHIYR